MKRYSWLAGLVAAGVALAVSEFPSAVSGGPSLVVAVGSRFIDQAAGSLRGPAVSIFGTNDKPALVIGIVVVSLILGMALGEAAARRWIIGVLGFAAFGVVGVLASAGDAQASMPAAITAAILGAGAGIVTLAVLLWKAPAMAVAAPAALPTIPVAQDPRIKSASRRQFFTWAGGASASAVAVTVFTKQARSSTSVAAARAEVELPAPVSTVALPTGGPPFDVAGLSPYVTPNGDFYRIDTALLVPQVRTTTWKLSISGLVDRPFSITYDELLAMEMVEEPITLQCVSNEIGGDLVGNAVWRGVPLKTLLDRAGVKAGGDQIVGHSVDGFTAGFPTSVLDGRTALVAVGMNGQPLPVPHGYPARLVVAGLYGYVSATKWLNEIRVTDLKVDGYWIPRGWSKDGPIKTMSRIDVPVSYRFVAPGHIPIAGVAWAPTRGISSVEIQIDKGPWLPVKLAPVASADTWVQWFYDWDAPKGSHTVKVRATDGKGDLQSAEDNPPAPDGATGYHTIQVNVR